LIKHIQFIGSPVLSAFADYITLPKTRKMTYA